MTDVREALMVGRTSDGKLVRRPLSPHLQGYKLPIIAVTSILHRLTGIKLAAGTLLLVWWLVAAATSDAAYATATWFIGSWIGQLMLFGWTAALWFHFCAGIRHLIWDYGAGFELETARAGSKALFVATAVLTVATWIVIFAVR